MRIANQPFMAQPVRNTKAVKSHEKTQTDKVTGTSEMSQKEEMNAFKKDFYKELSKITTHNTVSNMAVNVSEKAFEAMKADPAYKEKVLSLIKRDCQGSYGSRNASLVISVGATLDEYRGDAWPVGHDAEFGVRSRSSYYKSSKNKSEEDDAIRARYVEQKLQAMRLQQTQDYKRSIEKAELAKAESVSARERVIDTELKAVIVDEDFLAQVKAVREQQPKLEVSWDKMVDPDGSIAAKAYVESLVTQYQKVQNTIKAYYSGAHRDNLSQPSQTEALHRLSLKYTKLGLDMNSPYYRADMSEAERNMSFEQERALLLGGNLTMKDPYALASSGGLLNVKDADKIANQVVKDKLDELIKQWQQNNVGKFEK